jgi:aspartate racemase
MKIGILGGIGPEATGRFYLKLISHLQNNGLIKDNADFPQIMINSINAPELVFDKIEKTQLKKYIIGLKQLEKNNVDFIIMICNTIYLYYEILQNEIKTKIIDLRCLIDEEIKNEDKITIIGTPNTIKQDLYGANCNEILKLNRDEIQEISKSIFLFNKGIDKDYQINLCDNIAQKYKKKGSKIILGCTEIAVMLNNQEYFDTMDVFIDYITKTLNKQRGT